MSLFPFIQGITGKHMHIRGYTTAWWLVEKSSWLRQNPARVDSYLNIADLVLIERESTISRLLSGYAKNGWEGINYRLDDSGEVISCAGGDMQDIYEVCALMLELS